MANVNDIGALFPVPPPHIQAIIDCKDDRPGGQPTSVDQLIQDGATLDAWVARQNPMVQGLMAPAYVGKSCTARRLQAAADASSACNSFKVCNPFLPLPKTWRR